MGEIIRLGLRYPVKVTVKVKSLATDGIIEEKRTPASLQLRYIVSPTSRKFPLMLKLFHELKPRPQKAIVFLSTCAAVDYFQHLLPGLLPQGWTLVPLHGKLPHKTREKNFQKFSNSVLPTVLLTTDVASRGLDIPQVDLVVQIDPPTDPKGFIHRSGRAGRAGRRGLSVLFLRPGREADEYVPFLEVRKTPIQELENIPLKVSDEEVSALVGKMRATVLTDRALHDKAQRGFVSWVRAFSTHAASAIFRITELDWEDLGTAWALMKMPKMPELKMWCGDKTLGGISKSIDWENYGYKDKAREKNRRALIAAETEKSSIGLAGEENEIKELRKKRNAAWSGKHEKEEGRAVRKYKRQRKQEAKRIASLTDEEKVKEMELSLMIAEVRRRNMATSASKGEQEFNGFDD